MVWKAVAGAGTPASSGGAAADPPAGGPPAREEITVAAALALCGGDEVEALMLICTGGHTGLGQPESHIQNKISAGRPVGTFSPAPVWTKQRVGGKKTRCSTGIRVLIGLSCCRHTASFYLACLASWFSLRAREGGGVNGKLFSFLKEVNTENFHPCCRHWRLAASGPVSITKRIACTKQAQAQKTSKHPNCHPHTLV